MNAIITSVGEPTTDLCKWALERNGFEVTVLQNPSSLAQKLKAIYNMNSEFLRVDADIIVNKNMTPALLKSLDDSDIWWWQFTTFDWYKQDITPSVAYIKSNALPALRKNITRFLKAERPETELSRIDEFYNPRRFETYNKIVGIHGFGIRDIKPVIRQKTRRGQKDIHDFELMQKLNEMVGIC